MTKTKIAREVPIPTWVMKLLAELNLHKYPSEYYIFSGKGNMFFPGPSQMSPNVSSVLWRKIVKEGLGLDVNQYGIKKLSGNDMVKLQRREGAENLLELPQRMMGHSDQAQTEVYVTHHIDVMNDLIKNKMPEL